MLGDRGWLQFQRLYKTGVGWLLWRRVYLLCLCFSFHKLSAQFSPSNLLRHIPKPVLRPCKTPFMHRPRLHPPILSRGSRRHIHRHQVIHPRMRLPRIPPLRHPRHQNLPLRRVRLDRDLERLVKRHGVGERRRVAPRPPQVAQVVHRHARADNDDAFVAERGDGLAEAVVRVRVLVVEQRDLHQRAGERVAGRGEGDVEAREDAVVESAGLAGGADPGGVEELEDV